MQRRNASPGFGGILQLINQLGAQMGSTGKPISMQTTRNISASAPVYSGSVDALVSETRPAEPLYLFRPDRVTANARRFLQDFPGTTMYAVKCNPDRAVLQTMIRAGIKTFDCASIDEVRLIRKLAPKAKIYFMHPVKAREAIHEAYHKHNVRAFVLDCAGELYKILQETALAPDLELFVRVAIPKGAGALVNLSGKFGATADAAAELLRLARPVATRLGVSFHVGSQCLDPERYALAVDLAAQAIIGSGVTVDALDVGGGFPMNDGGHHTPHLTSYVAAIEARITYHKLQALDLLCEPGRALVSDAASVVVRIEQRKNTCLHINDGAYGTLIEMGPSCNLVLPHRLIRASGHAATGVAPFTMAGPTCDSYDMMQGPFMLPSDAAEGDYIVIDNIGSYGTASKTRFNGFGQVTTIVMHDTVADNVVAL
jgi:ornithine decarboxylase